MSDDRFLRDPEGFPDPKLDAWREKVAKDLRGRDYRDLAWPADDGEPLEPLATAESTDGLPHLAAAPQSWLGAADAWRIRELVVEARPADCAAQIRAALADGADEVEVCFDDLVRDAFDPSDDDPPGMSGAAIHTLDDFRAALDGVDLASTHLGISAGEGARAALAHLLCLAEDRGVEPSALRGDLDFDPLARLTQRQAGFDPNDEDTVVSTSTNLAHVFDETAAIVRECAERCPGIRPIALDAQGFHLCGATPTLEVGATIALVADVARQLAARGIDFDSLATASTLRLQVSHEMLTEVAKLRATRLLFAKLAHAFGATDRGMRPSVHGITSGRSRSYRFDTRTNLLRTTLAATAAVVGGCDSIAVIPFDEDPAHQDAAMRRLARHQQLLLRHESHLDAVRDPARGAFAIERLTDRFARAAWRHFQAIERAGGLCEAVRSGALLELLLPAAEARTRAFASRERTMVGINRYQDTELEGQRSALRDVDATSRELLARHRAAMESRGATPTSSAQPLDLDAACHALRAGATTGEVARQGWPDDVFLHRFPPIALIDGDEFEDLREAREDAPAAATVALLDDDKETAAAGRFAASILELGGYSVECPPPFESLDACHDAVGQSAPHIVVLAGPPDATSACVDRIAEHGCFIGIAGRDSQLESRGVIAFHDGMDVVAVLTSIADGGEA